MDGMGRITSYIAPISNYIEKTKEIRNKSGQNWYDYFYSPLQENFKRDVDYTMGAIETAGNYDISSAYAQYLQSQRQLTSSNISSGDIARLSKDSYNMYEQAYQRAKYNTSLEQQKAVGEISGAYDKLLTDEEKRIATEASMMRDIDMLYGSFVKENQQIFEEIEARTGKPTGLVGVDLGEVEMGSAEQKELYAKISEFFDKDYGTIADYILKKKGVKYYDFYAENQDKILQTIGGLEYGEDGKTLKTAKDYEPEVNKIKFNNQIKNPKESKVLGTIKDIEETSDYVPYLSSKYDVTESSSISKLVKRLNKEYGNLQENEVFYDSETSKYYKRSNEKIAGWYTFVEVAMIPKSKFEKSPSLLAGIDPARYVAEKISRLQSLGLIEKRSK